MAKRTQNTLTLFGNSKAAAMGQLLVTLIGPPIVGVVTCIIVRRIWDRDKNGAGEASRPAQEPSAVTSAQERNPMVRERSVMSTLPPKADRLVTRLAATTMEPRSRYRGRLANPPSAVTFRISNR